MKGLTVTYPDPGSLKVGQKGRCRVSSAGEFLGFEAGQERNFRVGRKDGSLWVYLDEPVYMKWVFTLGGTYMKDCNPQFFNANFDIVEANS